MKTLSFLCVVLLIFSTNLAAQNQNSNKPSTISHTGPVITKGYYAIGVNSDKLSPSPVLINADTAFSKASKGYYSTGKNAGKIKGYKMVIKDHNRRIASKGYYSIYTKTDTIEKP